jgi:hypothetical protein
MILVSSLLLFAILGCGKKPAQQIVGKWETDSHFQLEYLDDGTMIIGHGGSTITKTGKWRFLDDGRLKTDMQLCDGSHVEVGSVKFDGDTMTMTDEKGHSSPYKKVASFSPLPIK